jgi:voltage-gated potassium channel
MNSHYIVCGMGRIGGQIATELVNTNKEFVFGELDKEKIEKGKSQFKKIGLLGDCTEDDFLLKLGIKKAKGIFVTTDDDNVNLVICITARTLNPHIRIISCCKSNSHLKKIKAAGANKVISPNFIGGTRMASEMIRPGVLDFLDIMLQNKAFLHFEELVVAEEYIGKPISVLGIDKLENTVLLAINEKEEWINNPKPTRIIKPNSLLILMTNAKEWAVLQQFRKSEVENG